MKPISMKLLIHTATVKTITGKDADRNPTYSEEIELQNVRVSHKNGVTLTDKGYVKTDTMSLLFDCVNSLPKGFIPEENQIITFEANEYTTRTVTACYGDSNIVHHYEVELV